MTVANPILPAQLPFALSKSQIATYCIDYNGKPLRVDTLPRYLGDEVCQVIDYKSKRIFYGEELLVIFQRLFPKTYGHLSENGWWLERVRERECKV